MLPGSPIRCRQCDQVIVQRGEIRVWKDLPSENWAEMMEFWHCHKPSSHDQPQDEALATKGYAANTAITAQSGVCLVDIISFMLFESDCSGLSFSSTTRDSAFDTSALAMDDAQAAGFLHVSCKQCKTDLGLFNVLASSVTMFKWRIMCETSSPGPAPTSSQCLASALIATISRSGSARSLVSPLMPFTQDGATKPPQPQQSLYLWVFNPNVVYTSSIAPKRKTAMKLLYQDIDVEQGNKMIESITSNVQEIDLPTEAIQMVREALASSNLLLPGRERSFKEGSVGLLDRWVSNT